MKEIPSHDYAKEINLETKRCLNEPIIIHKYQEAKATS